MNFMLAVTVYVLLGVALIAAAAWYCSMVWGRFFQTDATPAIAPIEIIGVDDATTKSYGAGLPVMVVAATNALKSRTNLAIKTLQDARAELAQMPRPPEQEDLPVPDEFREPLEINLKIADVEVGSLLTYLLERARDTNLVRLTVAMSPNGGAANVYGFVPGKTEQYSFTVQSQNDLHSIAEAIATQLVQHAAQRGESAFAALDGTAFMTIVSSLETFARLTQSRRWVLTDAAAVSAAEQRLRQGYAAVLADVRELAQRYTGWEGLQWLAAQSAREARDWANAREFYGNLRRIAERSHDAKLRERVVQLTQEAERELASQNALLAAREGRTPRSAPLGPGASVARILEAIGMSEAGMASGIQIGVVGPPPPAAAGISNIETIGTTTSTSAEENLLDYQAAVAQAVSFVSPDIGFLYSPFDTSATTGTDAPELIASLERLIARKPPIILMTWGSVLPIDKVDALITRYADEVLFVLPAGNASGEASGYKNVTNVALVVAASTLDGDAAPFTSTADGVTWAPGVDMPIKRPGAAGSELGSMSGTSFSAAIAAGAAATLKHAFANATPKQIREALMKTSKPAPAHPDGPSVIDVPAAHEALRTALAGGS